MGGGGGGRNRVCVCQWTDRVEEDGGGLKTLIAMPTIAFPVPAIACFPV